MNEKTHPNKEGRFIPPRKDYGIRSLKYVNNPHEFHGSVHGFFPDENTDRRSKSPKHILVCIFLGRKQDIVDEVDQCDMRDPKRRHAKGDTSLNGHARQAVGEMRHVKTQTQGLERLCKTLFGSQAFAK
jgi:hypothetical protein